MNAIVISYVLNGVPLCEQRHGWFVPAMSDRVRFGLKNYRVLHRELTLSPDPWMAARDFIEVHLEEIV